MRDNSKWRVSLSEPSVNNRLTNNLEEIFLYFEENKEYFKKNESLTRALVRALIRNLDIENAVYYLNEIVDKDSSSIDAWASYIYFNNFLDKWDQKKFLESSKILDQKLIKYPSNELVELKGSDKKKINVGFHTADLRVKHSVTHFLKTILTNYNKDKFNINLYLGNKKEDQTTNEFKEYVNKAINITFMDDIEVINLVRNDKIDILFDLMGLTSNHGLSLYKNRLAPIQISWCGYLNTTGLKEMDYMIADRNIVTQEEQYLYSEKIIYLPNSYQPNIKNIKISVSNLTREKLGLPKDKFIFCSFNQHQKINPKIYDIWMSILNKNPNSILWLLNDNIFSNKNLLLEAKKRGIEEKRIIFGERFSHADHLERIKFGDLFLDTFPCTAHTTCSDALRVGLPVLTISGNSFVSRVATSLLNTMNLKELISNNFKEYEIIANKIVSDSDFLDKIKFKIKKNFLDSALYDAELFTKNLETAYEKVFKNYIDNKDTRDFEI